MLYQGLAGERARTSNQGIFPLFAFRSLKAHHSSLLHCPQSYFPFPWWVKRSAGKGGCGPLNRRASRVLHWKIFFLCFSFPLFFMMESGEVKRGNQKRWADFIDVEEAVTAPSFP
ncbi:hypothetical protein TRVL_01212 [Trypanosoma vivax]|uniref:Uncharacterized protein n=1 Tax=Trypanosoma vivax (strain Y486) TaxID=1055687 RepID=G0TSM9_TRYVY|nr:hypothetical protein TRVL_01212 [Trypanosoma vivax]CCC46956.1 hypothetical protein, unlikely [Trypanosoma vivax Y486]